MSLRLPLALLALLSLLAAGCGGGGSDTASREEFQQAVVNARDRVDFSLSQITKAKSKDDFLDRMEEASGNIDEAADDLEGVKPPEDFAPETDQLVDALHQLAVDLKATAEQIRQPGFEDLLSNAQGLNFESWDDANRAIAGLAGKGINVRLIQRH
jgi:hypothetical protein